MMIRSRKNDKTAQRTLYVPMQMHINSYMHKLAAWGQCVLQPSFYIKADLFII